MANLTNLFDLESLFIDKLQEKYKLNIRDIKRAFSRFDLDNNGLLDLVEMSKGIQMFLNGVQESQVQQLVSNYDLNGDGKISYEEFLHFLSTRSAIDPNDPGDAESESGYDDPVESYYQRRGGGGSRGGGGGGRPPSSGRAGAQRHPVTYYDDDEEQHEGTQVSGSQYSGGGGGYYQQAPSDIDSPPSALNKRQFASSKQQQQQQVRPSSAAGSEMSAASLDPNDPRALESRAKIYLQSLRAFLGKKPLIFIEIAPLTFH